MDAGPIEALRDDLDAAGFGVDAVASMLGAAADDARARGVFAPARLALQAREPSALGGLIGLFLLGDELGEERLSLVLPSLGAAGAQRLGLVERSASGGFRAAVSLNPVGIEGAEWRIVSDLDDQLRRGPARPDHVMGVGGATRSLIAQMPGRAVGAALDLGTGCGIVAMHLALAGSERVIATDVSERALGLARLNARLNGLADRIEFRSGSLFEPVEGERFDLVLSNPPFVITPRDGAVPQYEYRDAGLSADDLIRSVVTRGPALLRPGGALLCLANWEYRWGESGLERVRGWIERAAASCGPLDAWAIERERLEPARYAETWARDGGARPGDERFESLMESWLRDFSARRVVSVGMGSIRIRRGAGDSSGASPTVRLEHAPERFAAAPGAALDAAMTAGAAASRMTDEQLLERCWVRSDAVSEHREHRPGEESPRSISLHVSRPLERTVHADPLLAAAVGACDGELSLARIADALATLLEADAAACAEALAESVRELAWLGVLAPAAR